MTKPQPLFPSKFLSRKKREVRNELLPLAYESMKRAWGAELARKSLHYEPKNNEST